MVWYRFDHLLGAAGWASPGWLEVNAAGNVETIADAAPRASGIEHIPGHGLPGMPNLHSHAFQRAMAGLTERAGGSEDSFWTWREVMYGFVRRLTPGDLETIATQLYIEMLKAGYTSVGEFHYLHHQPDGAAYNDVAEMSERIASAARRTGIGLTLLPVLYAAGGFGGVPPTEGQRRFVNDAERFLSIVAGLQFRHGTDEQIRIGIAPHSLRAVPPDILAAVLEGLEAIDGSAPVHIHIAEQVKEVDDCRAWSRRRPVDWLLDNASVGPQWCLVHATHMTAGETKRIARCGAVAGLCPTTEANLGDGLFPLRRFLDADGVFGVGSDSHASVSPVEELRWLEYGQRLIARRRNIAATPGASTGAGLYSAALAGGARALGRQIGVLEPGARADLIVLDDDHPLLAGRAGDVLIDSYVFSGNSALVRDVMVGGTWVVRDRRHDLEESIAAQYRKILARLL